MRTISPTFHVDGKTHLLDNVRNNECKVLEKEHISFFIRGFPMISGFTCLFKIQIFEFRFNITYFKMKICYFANLLWIIFLNMSDVAKIRLKVLVEFISFIYNVYLSRSRRFCLRLFHQVFGLFFRYLCNIEKSPSRNKTSQNDLWFSVNLSSSRFLTLLPHFVSLILLFWLGLMSLRSLRMPMSFNLQSSYKCV